MDLGFDAAQLMLKTSAREFLSAECTDTFVREMEEDQQGFTPEFWQKFAYFNPFFYNIDGFRYAFIGKSDSSIILGSIFLIILNIILLIFCYLMFRTGYKL